LNDYLGETKPDHQFSASEGNDRDLKRPSHIRSKTGFWKHQRSFPIDFEKQGTRRLKKMLVTKGGESWSTRELFEGVFLM
jgi:hypothetical protein